MNKAQHRHRFIQTTVFWIIGLNFLTFSIVACAIHERLEDWQVNRVCNEPVSAMEDNTLTPVALTADTCTSFPATLAKKLPLLTGSVTLVLTALESSGTPVFLPPPSNTPLPTSHVTPMSSGIYSRTVQVPILMYHYVSIPPYGADDFRIDLSVTPDTFREQMAYLVSNGFTTINLYDLSLAIANEHELPPRPVIITIDDGYRDAYENAFLILREYGLEATLFVATEFVDQEHPAYLTWPMVAEMAAAGMRIESITKTHADLHGHDRDYLIWQILGSQETIAAHIGHTPRYFAYPFGHYDDQTIQILQELNFWGALTTANGTQHGFDDQYEWARLRVRHTTTLAEFAKLVSPDVQ